MKELYDEGSLRIESSQGEDCAFDWSGAEGGVETDEGVVEEGTGIMTKDAHFFLG